MGPARTRLLALTLAGTIAAGATTVASGAVPQTGSAAAATPANVLSSWRRNDSAIVAAANDVLSAWSALEPLQSTYDRVEEEANAWHGGRQALDNILARAASLEATATGVLDAESVLRRGPTLVELRNAEETLFSARGIVRTELRGVEAAKLRADELVVALNTEALRLRELVARVESGIGNEPDLAAVQLQIDAAMTTVYQKLGDLAWLVAGLVDADPAALATSWAKMDRRRIPVIATALSQVGKPYVFATRGPDSYDCSGFTSTVWRTAGRRLTAYSYAQQDQTTPVDGTDQMVPGDLIFWDRSSIPDYDGAPGHVAMYLGSENLIVEANGVGYVRVWRYPTPYLSGYGHVELPGETWPAPAQ